MAPKRKLRLSETRKAWAEQRGGATFAGKPLAPPDVIEARYKAQLDKLVELMSTVTARELQRLYRTSEAKEAGLAMDASFSSMAARLIRELQKRFNVLFSDKAGGLAEALVSGISRQAAVGLKESLKEVSGGVTLRTDVVGGAVADVVKASIKQNVALIKSIPQEFFLEIEGEVMRSIQSGRGMADLQPFLEKRYGITKRRAALIARDQTSKATTAINRARMQGLGVKKFRWLHSGGGKEPRPLHKNVLNGQVFSLDDPPVIDEKTGERGLPGQLINCFTGSTKVSLANGCRNLWRYWHSGDIVRIGVVGHPSFEATPNHPILTGRGWLAAHEIQEGDYLASSVDESERVVDGHNTQHSAAFADLYVALALAGNPETAPAAEFDFHGDVPENDVDSIRVEKDLSLRLKTGGLEELKKLVLAAPDSGSFHARPSFISEVFHSFGSSGSGEIGALSGGQLGEPNTIGAAPVSQRDTRQGENIADDLPGAPVSLRDFEHAASGLVELHHGVGLGAGAAGGFLRREFVLKAALEGAGGMVRADLVNMAEVLKAHPSVKGFHRVDKKSIVVFAGHVYTMETEEGWFPLAPAGTISKNCRCRMVPVVEFKAEEAAP